MKIPFKKPDPKKSDKPQKVIKALRQRRGFGNWWDTIDEEDREEILEEIKAAISE